MHEKEKHDNHRAWEKKTGAIWSHCCYHETELKTKHIALSEGTQFGHKAAGKNTTNLKRHIKALYKEIEVQ